MSLKICTIFLLITAIFSWILWFFIVQNFNPNEASQVVFLLFYLSFFIAILSTFCTSLLIYKIISNNKRSELEIFKFTFLNSGLMSIVIVVLLPLLHLRLLRYWSALLVLLIMFVVIIFLSRSTMKKKYAK
jgi:hypothetical protein